jgi:hypothetical protein
VVNQQEELSYGTDRRTQAELDLEAYKMLLDLWSRENPIKTAKLQVLLAVNGLLVSAISVSGGFTADKWFVYLSGAVFSLIWTFSIGRTSLFQDIWQIKMGELQKRYPADPRFSILEIADAKKRTRPMMRLFGGISSKWYLLFSPLGFAIAWLAILFFTR